MLGLVYFLLLWTALLDDPKAAAARPQSSVSILNVSFDPTRELFERIQPAFASYWREKTGGKVEVKQSHGGSGKQARAVIDGLEADVLSLALSYDIDMVAEHGGLVPADWRTRLPDNSSPFTSTIVFLVRAGNPKAITDWKDLAKPDVKVVWPNPKTSGGARWNYLAAWGSALRTNNNDEATARSFVAAVFGNVAVLDTGARGSTNSFAQRRVGDVLVGWESDALLVRKQYPDDGFEVVYPSVTITAEPAVAVVDKVATARGTTEVARGYLEFLYSETAQRIVAEQFFRPRHQAVLREHAASFPSIPQFTVDEVFGGWKKAHDTHFAEGGVFDQIQAELARRKP